jgi:WD40 repeat protein
MTTNKTFDQFNLRLDQLLGIAPGQTVSPVTPEPATEAALQTAGLLIEMNLGAESAPRHALRDRWAQAATELPPVHSTRSRFTRRMAWIIAMVLALALIVAFRQPVLAAVSRLFGYIYIQDTGFLPTDSTLVLQQPVKQEHNGLTLTVTSGVSTPDGTTLYLEFSATASPADGAFLETNPGSQLALSNWEYFPNTPGSHGVKLVFPALPAGITQTSLVLPAGWHLPLTWIPATQSHLPDVRAVPYVDATQQPTPAADLCVEKHGINLCLKAATTGAENTSVLLDAKPTNPALIPSSFPSLVWQSETEPVTLRDEQGNIYPLDNQRPMVGGTLTFPPIAGTHTLTLTIPALFASVDIPDQMITVDVGNDPQPDTVIPLDVNIQVMDTTVHFSKATFVGDGVNSLRLTLNVDEPVQTVDGITPDQLELGRPDRVDDLYGGGDFSGSKDIFVELIHGSEKITGVINLPIVSTTVIVKGPFEFTFTLSDTPAITPTPLVANPGNFSPAPTPTPLSLDSYFYSRRTLESGDLLYTVLDGDKTNVYAYTPGTGSQSSLVATLPGAVSQVYLHPDHQGLDYLAGVQANRDGISYIDDIRLYTVRFADHAPHLLYSFLPNSENTVGTSAEGDWSYDGRYGVFRLPQLSPGGSGWRFIWFDLSCRAGANCVPHEIVLPPNLDLFKAYFAPNDHRILFSGSDTSGTGEPDVFLLNFDPLQPDNQVVKIPKSMSISDAGPAPAIWTPDGKIFTVCWSGTAPEIDVFCKIDPATGVAAYGDPIATNLNGYRLFINSYWLSPSGDQLAALIFPVNATEASIPDLRLLDLNGHPGAIVASSFSITNAMFSPSGKSIAYMLDDEQRVEIYDVPTGDHITVFDGSVPSALSWIGWVR